MTGEAGWAQRAALAAALVGVVAATGCSQPTSTTADRSGGGVAIRTTGPPASSSSSAATSTSSAATSTTATTAASTTALPTATTEVVTTTTTAVPTTEATTTTTEAPAPDPSAEVLSEAEAGTEAAAAAPLPIEVMAPATSAVPRSSTAADFLAMTNATRAAVGVPALRYSADLEAYAQNWAQVMAGAQAIFHSNIADLLGPWSSVGENVGVGPTPTALHAALLASPPHYANIVHADFRAMGVGVVTDGGGRIYTTHVFAA